MNIYPTEEQKQKLRNLHQTSRDHHVRDRIRCILLSADSWTPGMIAQSQLIHEITVCRHLNNWLNSENLHLRMAALIVILAKKKTAELVTYLTNNLLPTKQAIIE